MRYLVVGCGRAGSRLAQLLSTQGHRVTVVDKDAEALARVATVAASPDSLSLRTVQGFGLDRGVLVEAGIERADGLAAVTGVDELNVVVARLARRIYQVPRVVARVYEPGKAEVYRRLGITTISPQVWGVDRMAEALVQAQLSPVLSIGSGEVNLVVFEVPPLLDGRAVQAINVPYEIQVTALCRDGHVLLPGPETVVRAGDRLYVALRAHAASRLEEWAGGAG
ncbi:MAG: potassium channel family protein [Caldilinea sp.]|jgi:trk system potassium uptake protein TrkA|nr:TrkA family potassium uptake protein [Chloroflexota bacterium]